MVTKICSKCKNTLPANEEYFASKKGKLQSYCRECHKQYRKQHYLENRQKYINKAAIYRKAFWLWFISLKETLSCVECGESRYWVLDFHHRNSEEKDSEVSTLVNSVSKTKVLQEIEKCDVLCSNCHRNLHYQERQVGNA